MWADVCKLGRTGNMYPGYDTSSRPLAFGIGKQRHLVARCRCGLSREFDARPWLQKRLGGVPIAEFEARLRCDCGQVGGQLEIWHGPPAETDGIPETYWY